MHPTTPGLPLGLQRQVGHRAVRAAFASPPTAQRFVGTEHKELGDSTGRTVDLDDGVVLGRDQPRREHEFRDAFWATVEPGSATGLTG